MLRFILYLIGIISAVVIGSTIGHFAQNQPILIFLGVCAFPFACGWILTMELMRPSRG